MLDIHTDWTQQGEHWVFTSTDCEGETLHRAQDNNIYLDPETSPFFWKYKIATLLVPLAVGRVWESAFPSVVLSRQWDWRLRSQWVLSAQIGYYNRNSSSPCFASPVVGRVLSSYTCVVLTAGRLHARILFLFHCAVLYCWVIRLPSLLFQSSEYLPTARRRHWYVLYFHWATGLSYRFEIAGVRVVFARTFVLPPTIPFREQRRIP